jgi:type I restriction enzyme R subunit
VNQFTVIEGQNNRRADIVVFVNGLPLGIIELKIPEDTDKWFAAAYNQIQTYKQEIPSLMHYNEVTVISDRLEAHCRPAGNAEHARGDHPHTTISRRGAGLTQ